MKLKFKANLNKDMWNWEAALNRGSSYGMNWLKKLPKDIKLKDARNKEKLRKYLNSKYYKKKVITKYVDWLQAEIDPLRISLPLKNITGKNIPFTEVYVVVTTFGRCPYDYDDGGFFVFYGASPDWIYTVALHECMHLIIHKYYWKEMLKAGLTNEQAHDIKEALTVLLNEELKKYGHPEKGYPNHQNLRKDIERISKKTKRFEDILQKTILIYKKKYLKSVS